MPEDQPNILLFLTDHFRADMIGPSTPNLRRLASMGTRCEQAYCASPLCMPSRNSIVTGLLPSQNGVCGNMAAPIDEAMRADTYPSHLRSAGYRTALVGKHHWIDSWGLNRDVTEDHDEIRKYGFDDVVQVLDEFEQMHNDDAMTHHLREQGRLDQYREVTRANAARCGAFDLPETDYADRFIADRALDWLKDHAAGEQPFYLNVSFVGPHPPFWHPGDCDLSPDQMPAPIGAADAEHVRQRRAHYMQKCILIDQYVGEILDQLEAHNALDNTLIVFTSDHGDTLGDFGIWDKRTFYDHSVRVPFLIAGPGVPAGSRGLGGRISRQLVSLLDLYPTFLTAAGLDMETCSPRRRFGRDLRTILQERRGTSHDTIVAELGTHAMLFDGAWKLVFDPEQGGVVQLFNHRNDPQELTNLAGVAGYENVTADLLGALLSERIGLTQYTHEKEETRLQRVRR